MQFFIPGAPTPEVSEGAYEGICKFIGVTPVPARDNRIWGVRWRHEDHEHMAKINRRLDGVADAENVIAIVDAGDRYAICTQNNGVLTGEPIWVKRADVVQVWKFAP